MAVPSEKSSQDTIVTSKEISISRLIKVPKEKVFAAFSDSSAISNWWGPNGFTTTTHSMDFKPGGKWIFTMHGPDGTNYENMIIYREIEVGRRIAYDHHAGEHGPLHFKGLTTFADEAGGTRVTLSMTPPTPEELERMKKFGAIEGGQQTLARLNAHVARAATFEPFVISRDFDAPRELVFAAFTEPERMKHWWGPKGFKVLKQTMILKPGGYYHFGLEGPNGAPMWGKFVYREIVPNEKVVWVHSFSDEAGGITRHPMAPTWPREMLATLTLQDVAGGKTRLTMSWHPINETADERDTFDKDRGSMTQGWSGTFEQLETYLKSA